VAALLATIALLAGLAGRDTQRAEAAFHLAHIEEVMFGYGGDSSLQYVEIRMLAAGQNIVRGSRLSAWNANGSFHGILLEVPASPSITGNNNGRWTMATAGHTAASGVAPDFVFAAASLPPTGMICWGAPGLVPEFPPTWDATVPTNYIDCVPYGGYVGAPPGTIPAFAGTATALGLGDGAFQALQRTGDTNNTSADFAYGCPSPQSNNNALGYHHDANYIELGPTKAFDDLSLANSDTVGNDCGDTDDDNDGRSDADELSGAACGAFGPTDPKKRDTDGDNYLDGAECNAGKDPNNIASRPTTAECGVTTDADLDGIATFREICFYNTNPNAVNTDGDACNDGREVAPVNASGSVDVIDLGAIAAEAGNYTLPGSAVKVDFDATKNGSIDVIDLGFVAARAGNCP
jgi:hypothetical protein